MLGYKNSLNGNIVTGGLGHLLDIREGEEEIKGIPSFLLGKLELSEAERPYGSGACERNLSSSW